MATGVLTLPAIPFGFDDMNAVPAWVWIGFVSWIGTYFLYPAWAIAMGIRETRRATSALPASTVSG